MSEFGQRLSRREFLRLAASATGVALIGGCAEPAPSSPIAKLKVPEAPPPQPTPDQQLERHRQLHYPKIEGKEIPAQPYLHLPIRRSDLPGGSYEISEGWIYSQEEQAIHRIVTHGGVDVNLPYGTLLVAPEDGFAMSSYDNSWRTTDAQGTRLLYQGEPIRFGLGYFVQLYFPPIGRYVQIAHLSDIDPSVPFSIPIYNAQTDSWIPQNHTLSPELLAQHPMVARVQKGQPIGRVGQSGLGWGSGATDYRTGEKRPVVTATSRSWDKDIHVHLEEFARDSRGAKVARRDLYAIYGTFDKYPTPGKPLPMGKDPLFILGADGLPELAA